MSSSLKISNLFNKFSWTSFVILVIVSIVTFFVSIISYSNWKKLDIPTYENCKPGFTKNFDNFPINGIIEPIIKEQEDIQQPIKQRSDYGPGPFKSVFKTSYTGFFETNGIRNFTLYSNVVSQDSSFTVVVEESDNTKDWKPIQDSVMTSKLGYNTIDFKTDAKYLRLSLVTNGRNVVISSLRINANVENQISKKENVEKTMFGTVISSTLLMTLLIVIFLVLFVDIRKVYEYLVKQQNLINEKNSN